MFLEMKGIVEDLGEIKIQLKLDAKSKNLKMENQNNELNVEIKNKK